MKYSKCTLKDLQQFAKNRNLTVSTARSKRRGPTEQDYIKALEQADRSPPTPFRFLGLPAEMRNRVYEALLDNGSLATADPSILAVCRQIHDEAREIPFSANEFVLTIIGSTIRIQGLKLGTASKDHHETVMGIQWPVFLQRVQKMTIAFAWPHAHARTYLENRNYLPPHGAACTDRHALVLSRANHILFSLCSFLARGNTLQHLTIDLDTLFGVARGFYSCACMPATFRPLRLLASMRSSQIAIRSTFNGAIKRWTDPSTGQVTTVSPGTDMVPEIRQLWLSPVWTRSDDTAPEVWSRTINKAQMCHALQRKVRKLEWRSLLPRYGQAVERPTLDSIIGRLLEIQSLFVDGRFIDGVAERTMTQRLGALRGDLDVLDFGKLREEVREAVGWKSRLASKRREEEREAVVGNSQRWDSKIFEAMIAALDRAEEVCAAKGQRDSNMKMLEGMIDELEGLGEGRKGAVFTQ